jgi:hypothetical protein
VSSLMVNVAAEHRRRRGPRRAAGLAVVAIASFAISLAFTASPALAIYSHNDPAPSTFLVSPECAEIQDISILEPENLIYVSCATSSSLFTSDFKILRFHLDGSPAPFSANEPYINGNEITSDPGNEYGSLGGSSTHVFIAVDSSSSVNHGRLFITSVPGISVFNFSGEFAFEIPQRVEQCCVPNENEGVDVDSNGFIYIISHSPSGRISKYTPQLQEVRKLYTFEEDSFNVQYRAPIRVDSTGAVWVRKNDIRKFEADQFTTELNTRYGKPADPKFKAVPSPFVVPNPLIKPVTGVNGNNEPLPHELGSIGLDPTSDELYVDRENRIEGFSPGTPTEPAHRTVPPFGAGKLTDSYAVAVGKNHHVYASTTSTEGNKIVDFGPGDILPNVHTFAPQLGDVGHHEVAVHGKVELDGGSSIKECKFEYGTTTAYSSGSVPCSPDPASSPPGSYFGTDTEVSATIPGLVTGQLYHYRLAATNEKGSNQGSDRVVTPAFVLKTQTLAPTAVDDHGATLAGSFDPDGSPTEYKFEYGLTKNYGLETEFAPGGSGFGVVTHESVVSSLPSGKTFHYRVVAKNSQGATFGEDKVFRTASAPNVYGARATEVTDTSATLNATIDPVGYETKYRFDYGTTIDYGQSVPATLTSIGSGTEPVSVSQNIENLQPGVTYHFKVIAENKWGETASDDTTFDFGPPACPNSHIRQQTGASYLPDCRAYELVSPGSAGSAIPLPSEVAANDIGSSNTLYAEETPYVMNRGFATSPPRFSYWTALTSFPETNSPVGIRDMYLATRTSTGWVNRVPGLHGNEAYTTGRKLCSETLSICADHSEATELGFHREGAPYVFNADGKYQGRLPTNLKAIEATSPDAARYVGGQVVSGDFSHYVFSSDQYVFAPGGVLGGIGSAYDNDIAARTVTVVSKLPNGEDIPLQVSPLGTEQKKMDFRGISPNGSHILMETPGAPNQKEFTSVFGTPGHLKRFLFMRVDDSVTYDISRGFPVEPVGMTRNGEKVFFVTKAQMPGTGDTDNSTDLYMWEEKGDKLTLLSQGNGNGNTDSCNATWGVEGCGVLPLTPEQAHPRVGLATSVPGLDDLYAEESGDIYFYSPEQLDPQRPGIKNQKNLYLYRNGAVKLVATLEPGTEISRVQISPDGHYAAFLTNSQLSPFDTKGFKEVYTYNADTGVIRCASCNPDGSPPTGNAAASQGGRFMTNDGRTFFATPDALVSRDQNGSLFDVYEYVGGRPQLISSGLGNSDFTGNSETVNLFLQGAHTGLEAVSRDGTDVYFTTFDTLVKQDLNGEFLKFYDARSGGGFPQDPGLGPCAAADECHGADSSPPTEPTVASDTGLGGGGNVASTGTKPGKSRAQRHKKHKKHPKHRRSSQGHGNG